MLILENIIDLKSTFYVSALAESDEMSLFHYICELRPIDIFGAIFVV